jgi:hypothetical protein
MCLRTNEEDDKEKKGSCGLREDFGPVIRRLVGLHFFFTLFFSELLLLFLLKFLGIRGKKEVFKKVAKHV